LILEAFDKIWNPLIVIFDESYMQITKIAVPKDK